MSASGPSGPLVLSSADLFHSQLFLKNLSGLPSESQTVLIKVRPDILSGLIWVQTVCKGCQQTTLVGKELTDLNPFMPNGIPRTVHFSFKGSWVVFFTFIQKLIEHSVSKQWRT